MIGGPRRKFTDAGASSLMDSLYCKSEHSGVRIPDTNNADVLMFIDEDN